MPPFTSNQRPKLLFELLTLSALNQLLLRLVTLLRYPERFCPIRYCNRPKIACRFLVDEGKESVPSTELSGVHPHKRRSTIDRPVERDRQPLCNQDCPRASNRVRKSPQRVSPAHSPRVGGYRIPTQVRPLSFSPHRCTHRTAHTRGQFDPLDYPAHKARYFRRQRRRR